MGRWLPERGWVLAWMAVLPLSVMRAGVLAESDTFWQISTGEIILDTGRVPTTDPFSWSMRGQPWHLNSWGFDVLLALAHRLGGLTAVALLGAALMMVVHAAMLFYARQLGATVRSAAIVVALTHLLMVAWYSVRPHMIDYIALPLLIVLTRRAMDGGETGRRRYLTLAWIAVLSVAWVNLHAATLLGVGITGLFGLARLVADRSVATLLRVAPPVLITAAGSLLNPRSLGLVTQTFGVGNASTGIITEWSRIDLGEFPDQGIVPIIGVFVTVVLARRRAYDVAVLCGGLTIAGIEMMRFLPILVVVAAPYCATVRYRPRPGSWLATRARMLSFGALLTLVLLVAATIAGAVQSATHLGRPIIDVGVLRTLPTGCKLFNSDRIGGPTILLRPDVPVALDGRNDMYGRRYVLSVRKLLRGTSGGPAGLDRLGITCVAIEPDTGLARQLDRSDRWVRAGQGRRIAVFMRR